MKKVRLITLTTLFLVTMGDANSGKQISFIVERTNYHNDFQMGPSLVFHLRLITTAPVIKKIGVQLSYSKLPYFTGDYPRLYRDRVSWFALTFIKPISLRLDQFELSLIPGLGTLSQTTWHDDLVHDFDEPGCFGCGDYYTPEVSYWSFEIHSEINYRFVSKFEIGIGLAYRNFLGPFSRFTDIHNPPALGQSFGTYFTVGKSF